MSHVITIVNGTAKFECTNALEAPCHVYSDCDCDYFEDGHDLEHPKVLNSECWLDGWFLDHDAIEMLFDHVVASWPENHSAEIDYEWNDCPIWSFVEPHDSETGADAQ